MSRAIANRLARLEDRLGLAEVEVVEGACTPAQVVAGRAALIELLATREGPLSRERVAEVDARLAACPSIELSAEVRRTLASIAASVGKPATPFYSADGTLE